MTPPHKGIILAGGRGTRLGALTSNTSKQLLPVDGHPMVHYPLATLMRAGVRETLVISTPQHLPRYRELLGDGSDLGISLSYAPQPRPGGIAQAPLIAAPFLAGAPAVLALGDNLFLGDLAFLAPAVAANTGATVFTRRVGDPENYGVAGLDPAGSVRSLQEKPGQPPPGARAITGLYVLDASAPEHASRLAPSDRGELEITALLQVYLDRSTLRATPLPAATMWIDAGTPASLARAGELAAAAGRASGTHPADLHAIAHTMGFTGGHPPH